MTGLELPVATIAALVVVSFLAGWIDSIVGGGGLIQLPALLIGLPADVPVATIAGTNKVPSSMGTAVAATQYVRRVPIDWLALVPLIAGSAVGSYAGTQVTHLVSRAAFNPLVLAAIVGVGWYTYRRPALGLASSVRHTGRGAHVRLAGIGLLVGLWDGFVGPGTGSFFVILLVSVMGHEFLAATAYAKLANLTTNLAAIASFGLTGHIWWGLALVMGLGNLVGGFLGSAMALRGGNGFVRRVFLAVIVVLGVKIAWDTLGPLLLT